MNAPPTTAAEARALGWEVDTTTYPWCAYLGPRLAPHRIERIFTPTWTPTPCGCRTARFVPTHERTTA